MGKKKSVVLMVLLTIVIFALCALTAFPAFPVGKVQKWNPAVLQYDFGADLGGGYYAYYYPKGVKSEAEFNDLDDDAKSGYQKDEGGLYLSKDEDDNVLGADGKVTKEFQDAFKAATNEICARYAEKQYSDFKVAVVNNYALRVELPAYEISKYQEDAFSYVSQTIELFSLTGELSIAETDGTTETTVEELKDNKITNLIKEIYLDKDQNVVYLRVKFTKLGKEMVEDFVTSASSTSTDSTTSVPTNLNLKVGDRTVLQVGTSYITASNNIYYPLANDSEIRHAETLAILLNSAMNGSFDIEFTSVTDSEIRTFDAANNVVLYLYIMILVAIVAMAAYAIVKMGRYGVVNLYTMLSYFIITALCFAFVSKGVFEVSLGTALIFLAGLALTTVLNSHVYNAIKAEFLLGKTVESSVKGGYKKTLFGIVDIYAVLLLGGIALLIGGAGLYTFALQALICIVAGAFVNLLWSRAINYVFLSASKNKHKYFRFVREEDEDDE